MNQDKRLIALTLAAVVVTLGGLTGCTTATPTDTPGVDQLGEYLLRFKGPDVETVVGFRQAAAHPGSDWLMLELAVTSPLGEQATVKRDEVWVRTPAGDRVKLASQEEFGQDYAGLRAYLSQADVVRDPMDYFPPSRSDCPLGFFAAPGTEVVFDQVSVNYQRVCQGRLFFKIPGGVQPGRWVLGIDLPETTVRISFTL